MKFKKDKNYFALDIQNENNTNAVALKALASKVLFALSQNHFAAVFNRISARIQELTACSEENPDYSDIELIQHIDMDTAKLTKLLQGKKTILFLITFLKSNLNNFLFFVLQF